MSLIAVITRVPRLELSEWTQCIDSTAELVRPTPRNATNPFTGEPTVVRDATGTAEIVVHGKVVGAIEPSPEFFEDAELHVYAPEGRHIEVQDVVTAVAAALGADVQWV